MMSELQQIKSMQNHSYLVVTVQTVGTKARALELARQEKQRGNESSAWIQGWDDDEEEAVQLQLYDSSGSKNVIKGVVPAICEECNPQAARV